MAHHDEDIYRLLLKRNAAETDPFVLVHAANATLLNQVDGLQRKYEQAEREITNLRQQLIDASANGGSASGGGKVSSAAATAALKNESRLRDKLEKLQEELNDRLKKQTDEHAEALKTAKELSDMKDLNTAQENTINNLRDENDRAERAIEHLTNEVNEARSRTDLAEKQYEGLKRTIRSLQRENDDLRKENRELETRMVSDKGKSVDEMNVLTEMVNALKKEVDMLRSLKHQEGKRSSSWFGGGMSTPPSNSKSGKGENTSEQGKNRRNSSGSGRKWGNFGVIPPSSPTHKIVAHTAEGTCVRYDGCGSGDLVCTAGSDSAVRAWDAKSGAPRATLRGSPGHSMICCDMRGELVAGAGSDKTCKIWNVRTERMIHQLVGHVHKVTCVRLFGGSAITGGADRCLKVWDISCRTYHQTVTLRHGSTSNCVDVGSDINSAVSGHFDGGIRFWDLRTGKRSADLSGMHDGAITSVQIHPTSGTLVLTNGLDSCCKVVDVRMGTALHELRHPGFSTSQSWSHSSFSPDGRYAAAGSAGGDLFVWNTLDGSLASQLAGHEGDVCGVDWGRGGSSGQQVASLDRKGVMILWA